MIIIDGYNVIMAAPDIFSRMPDLGAQRDHLVKLLQSYPGFRGKKIMVIFDGGQTGFPQHPASFGKIKIMYSRPEEEADDVIKRIIRENAARQSLTVVSSDRSIRNSAEDHAAGVMTASQLWKLLRSSSPKRKIDRDHPQDRELSDKEVNDWLRLFQKNTSGNHED